MVYRGREHARLERRVSGRQGPAGPWVAESDGEMGTREERTCLQSWALCSSPRFTAQGWSGRGRTGSGTQALELGWALPFLSMWPLPEHALHSGAQRKHGLGKTRDSHLVQLGSCWALSRGKEVRVSPGGPSRGVHLRRVIGPPQSPSRSSDTPASSLHTPSLTHLLHL